MDVLLQHGADIHAVTADGMAAIHIAAKNEFIEVARVLLAKDCSVISSSNDQDSNHTPLYYAGIHRRSQIVKNFLKRLVFCLRIVHVVITYTYACIHFCKYSDTIKIHLCPSATL